MRLIGVHGKAKSGKTEFSNILCMCYGFIPLAFADKVKEFAIKYFAVPTELIEHKTVQSRIILQGIGAAVRNHTFMVSASLKDTEIKMSTSIKYPIWVEDIAIQEFAIEPILLKNGRKRAIQQILKGIYEMFINEIDTFINLSDKNNSFNIWINYLMNQINDNGVYIITDVRYKNEKEEIAKRGGKNVKISRVDTPEIESRPEHESETSLDLDHVWDAIIVNQHKSDWHSRMSLSASNLIRKLDSINFFSEEDKKNFKLKINTYEE